MIIDNNLKKYITTNLMNNHSSRSLFHFLANEYYYLSNSSERIAAYNKAVFEKKTYVKKYFKDFDYNSSIKIPMIDSKYYSLDIYERVKYSLKTKDAFTKDEIISNRVISNRKILNMQANVGTKVTKLLTKFATKFDNNTEPVIPYRYVDIGYIKERLINNMYAPIRDENIYLSYDPLAFVAAGLVGESCLSPEGENNYSVFGNANYKNALVAFNKDWSWRAFVWIEHEDKIFTINKGYPQENYAAQLTIIKYFEERGYEYVSGDPFCNTYIYHDSDNAFYEDFQESNSNYHVELEVASNKCLITGNDISYNNTIYGDSCAECGRLFIGDSEEGYCSSCEENNGYHYCESLEQNYLLDDLQCYGEYGIPDGVPSELVPWCADEGEPLNCHTCMLHHTKDKKAFINRLKDIVKNDYIELNQGEQEVDYEFYYKEIKDYVDKNSIG